MQEPHSGTGWRAQATFPRDGGRFWDVEKIGEDRLADVHVFADCGDFIGGNGLSPSRELMRARGDFAGGVIRALSHAGEEFVEAEIRDFVFFVHSRI